MHLLSFHLIIGSSQFSSASLFFPLSLFLSLSMTSWAESTVRKQHLAQLDFRDGHCTTHHLFISSVMG